MKADLKECSIAVVGLGYVGMPLALKLAHNFKTIGLDINKSRIESLKAGHDENREVEFETLRTTSCVFTEDLNDIKDCDIYIVTVPTPVDDDNKPDLTALENTTKAIGSILTKDNIVVYESTVYPGITEGFCGKILEEVSGLSCGKDFFLGYSPERINPGDKEHTVENITKVVAGQTPEVTDLLCDLYSIVNGGKVFKAKNIMTAEASKAIENAQRDINVAFINEITMILNKMGLSIYDVLAAANTKWNFLPFVPGLVGGHCISVDPYYLAQCAENLGHTPKVILSGREINDSMGSYIGEFIHDSLSKTHSPKKTKVLVLGFTFKENITDIRNTKVIDVINSLKKNGYLVDVHDPYASTKEVKDSYNLDLLSSFHDSEEYDAIVPLVPHTIYKEMSLGNIQSLLSEEASIFDVKGMWSDIEFNDDFTYKTL